MTTMSEQLKARVLAKCQEVANGSKFWETAFSEPFTQVLRDVLDNKSIQYKIQSYWDHGHIETTISESVPSESTLWPLAAKILGVEQPKEVARPSDEMLKSAWQISAKHIKQPKGISEPSVLGMALVEFNQWLATLPPDTLAADRELALAAVGDGSTDSKKQAEILLPISHDAVLAIRRLCGKGVEK
jgi:hypothetical protein